MQPRWGCAACGTLLFINIKSLRDLEKWGKKTSTTSYFKSQNLIHHHWFSIKKLAFSIIIPI